MPNRFATTTSDLAGWQIEEYLGVVTTHVVAGVGLFSEFFASFSDVFGGRSESYRRQLASLYDEATGRLIAETHARRGNWLIGLRVDIDEVSGKGTQLFMITASGTAVRAVRLPGKLASRSPLARASGKEVEVAKVRLEHTRAAREGKLHLSDHAWAFLIEHRVGEIAGDVLEYVGRYDSEHSDSAETRRRATSYFAAIAPEQAVEALYAGLAAERMGTRGVALEILNALELMDLRSLSACLAHSDHDVRHRALQTVRNLQPIYGMADLPLMAGLVEQITTAFPDRSQVVEKKNILGKAKDVWVCLCGERNELQATGCHTCFRDRRGFRPTEVRPETAAAILRESLEAVRYCLEEPNGELHVSAVSHRPAASS